MAGLDVGGRSGAYVRTDTFAGVDHHSPRWEHALYMDAQVVWGRVGAPAIVGHNQIWGCMREREDIVHCSSEPASADQLKRAVVFFSFFLFLLLLPAGTRALP